MKECKNERTANLAMAAAVDAGHSLPHIGKHFDKKVPKRVREKQGFSFRCMFKMGAIK